MSTPRKSGFVIPNVEDKQWSSQSHYFCSIISYNFWYKSLLEYQEFPLIPIPSRLRQSHTSMSLDYTLLDRRQTLVAPFGLVTHPIYIRTHVPTQSHPPRYHHVVGGTVIMCNLYDNRIMINTYRTGLTYPPSTVQNTIINALPIYHRK